MVTVKNDPETSWSRSGSSWSSVTVNSWFRGWDPARIQDCFTGGGGGNKSLGPGNIWHKGGVQSRKHLIYRWLEVLSGQPLRTGNIKGGTYMDIKDQERANSEHGTNRISARNKPVRDKKSTDLREIQ
jgi:hypothetical protein